MQFELVSPERSLASLVAVSVEIPGADGDMTVMSDHRAYDHHIAPRPIESRRWRFNT